MFDWVGWLATAVFVTSYFTKQSTTLRRIQGVAACLWCAYGLLINALPVIVANVLVAGVAFGSSFRRESASPPGVSP
ncbi:MAG TPA: hypothetical protein VGQ06_00605 [Gemmatimonadales bacterium]|jgi:uncharacterized protein with PQ loop repeat|nr:hypothetical protein [Gemmatimonadales bacterium]